jgi:excisionase family DNA binding protein
MSDVVPTSPYISVEEAAQRLGRSERTIRELCRTKKLPHRKWAAGSSPIMLIPAELDRWGDGAPVVDVTPPNHPGRIVKTVTNGDGPNG